MRQKSASVKEPGAQAVKNIRRATRRHFSAEDKIRIVLEGLRGEDSIAELCRREGISVRGLSFGARSRGLWAFSIITMAASIITPMPPRLMMLEPSPISFMAPKHQDAEQSR